MEKLLSSVNENLNSNPLLMGNNSTEDSRQRASFKMDRRNFSTSDMEQSLYKHRELALQDLENSTKYQEYESAFEDKFRVWQSNFTKQNGPNKI